MDQYTDRWIHGWYSRLDMMDEPEFSGSPARPGCKPDERTRMDCLRSWRGEHASNTAAIDFLRREQQHTGQTAFAETHAEMHFTGRST